MTTTDREASKVYLWRHGQASSPVSTLPIEQPQVGNLYEHLSAFLPVSLNLDLVSLADKQ